MMVPMFGVGRGSGISGPGITIMRESDVRMGYLASALLIILALPLGLIFARIATDKTFRYCT